MSEPRSRLRSCGWLFFIFILCPFLYLFIGANSRAHLSNAGAKSVTLALEKYRVSHGAYPENLATLVPADLEAIPDGIMGYKTEAGEFHFLFCCEGLVLFPWEDYYDSVSLRGSHPEWFRVEPGAPVRSR